MQHLGQLSDCLQRLFALSSKQLTYGCHADSFRHLERRAIHALW